MKKILLVIITICSFHLLKAQSGKITSTEMLICQHNDSAIMADMINPLLNNGATVPDWTALGDRDTYDALTMKIKAQALTGGQ